MWRGIKLIVVPVTLALYCLILPAGFSLTITVPTDQPTIQAGIDAASAEDTVYVLAGDYAENIVMNKRVTVQGERISGSLDDLPLVGPIHMTASGAQVSRLHVDGGYWGIRDFAGGCTIREMFVTGCDYGMQLTAGNTVSDNTISQCFVAIQIVDANNTVMGNRFTGSSEFNFIWIGYTYEMSDFISGLPAGPAGGLENNLVTENLFDHGGGIAVMCNCSVVRNTLSRNFFWHAGGIVLAEMADSNRIIENTFAWCSGTGVQLDSGTEGDSVYHNDFVGNDDGAYDGGINVWDAGYPQGGNYWDELEGVDFDGDGIYDDPFPIPGGTGVDRYPLATRHNFGCGDVNCSWFVDIDDVVYLVDFVFSGGEIPCTGECVGNVDGSSREPIVDIDDIVYLIEYVFGGGPSPVTTCCD